MPPSSMTIDDHGSRCRHHRHRRFGTISWSAACDRTGHYGHGRSRISTKALGHLVKARAESRRLRRKIAVLASRYAWRFPDAVQPLSSPSQRRCLQHFDFAVCSRASSSSWVSRATSVSSVEGTLWSVLDLWRIATLWLWRLAPSRL